MYQIEIASECCLMLLYLVLSISIIISVGFAIKTIKEHYRIKREYENLMLSNKETIDINENRHRMVEYSEKMLEIIRLVISHTAVLKFRTWKDGRDLNKVTLSNLRDLAKSVAESVDQSINRKNILFDDSIFTSSFFNEYIIETSFTMVKELFERHLEDDISIYNV